MKTLLRTQNLGLSKVKAEVATGKTEVLPGKAEVTTDCAKYENVNPGAIFFDRC
ncbi:hypothetical protein [Nostoc sp.]|uniref:hypothetical protein n=1 Tax=Nostoc sp. TaxID=1180 RepID=UPI002FF5C863